MDMARIQFDHDCSPKAKEAIWQYCLDHSKLQKNGYWGIMFYVKDEEDLWRRVVARHSGEFQRYNKLEKQSMQDTFWSELYYFRKKSAKNSLISNRIDKSGSWWEKFLLYVNRKIRTYLFEKKK